MTVHKPPSYLQLVSELPRSGLETARVLFTLRDLVKNAPQGDGRAILTIPGYGGGDSSMLILRYFLNQTGYKAYPLNLGRNLESAAERIKRVEDAVAFREKMVAQVNLRAEEIAREVAAPVTLIGWSLGGLYAFDVSQQNPDIIKEVITLAAPFGDPRGTSAFSLLRKLSRSDVPIEEQDFASWISKGQLKHSQVPIKIIYSSNDGIVAPHIARLDEHPSLEHIEVSASHMGFTVNADALRTIARLLHQSSTTTSS